MGKNPAISRNASAAAYWDEIRRSFDAAAAVAEAAAEPAVPDAAAIELSDWADNRAGLGIRHQDSDFIGLSADDDVSGFPSWRSSAMPEQVEFSELDRYAEERAAAGIRNASSVFGVDAPQPRQNASPWSVV